MLLLGNYQFMQKKSDSLMCSTKNLLEKRYKFQVLMFMLITFKKATQTIPSEHTLPLVLTGLNGDVTNHLLFLIIV